MRKGFDPTVDDGLGLRHRRMALFLPGFDHMGQIVHGVEVGVVEGFDFHLDIARNRQIDQKHGPAFALFQRPLHRAQTDDGQRAGRATHHDIELVQAVG